MSHRRFTVIAVALLTVGFILQSTRAAACDRRGERNEDKVREHRQAILDRIYLHLEREEAGPILAALSNNVAWWMNGRKTEVIPFAGIYEGRRQVHELLHAFFEALDITELNRQLVVMQGDRAVAHIEIVAKVKSTGKTFALEFAQVWTFDDRDRVVELHSFHDTWSLWRAFQPGGETYIVDRRAGTDYSIREASYDAAALVMSAYNAFFSDNLPATLAMFRDDNVWMLKGDDRVPYVGTFIGPQGLNAFVTAMLSIAAYTAIPTFPYVVAEGNRVDVYILEPQVNIFTGQDSLCHIIHSYVLDENGMIVEMTSYNDSYEIHDVFGPED